MKLRQNVRHFAAKQALTMPVVGEKMNEKLVDLHVSVFGDRAEDGAREAREPRMEAFFDCTMATYLAALSDGYPEAEAREITHLQANFDFYNHGWTEMMEFPVDEVEEHYDRYAAFFEAHDITIDDPLGSSEIVRSPTHPRRRRNSTIPSTPTPRRGSPTTCTSRPSTASFGAIGPTRSRRRRTERDRASLGSRRAVGEQVTRVGGRHRRTRRTEPHTRKARRGGRSGHGGPGRVLLLELRGDYSAFRSIRFAHSNPATMPPSRLRSGYWASLAIPA
ncbi:hypothetical protein SY89_02735 [Halolamina pelagica]|uniref:Uncharacterized protein n=1 Tax=Halolamina pelagica TaxID=699431 RepID=A0A0P7H113_9EURY|nr:hypothetical protein SY89_02735 [Halolamina pelagica]